MMSNEELYDIILKHFENVDKLADVLEGLLPKLKEMDLRICALEGKKPKQDENDSEGMPVLA